MPESSSSNLKRKLVHGAAAALTIVGTALGPMQSKADNPPPPKPTEVSNPPQNSSEVDGVTIYYNPDGLPTSYQVDDKTYQIPKEEVEKMKTIKARANKNHTPELLFNIQGRYILPQTETYSITPDKPMIFDMPTDVMTDEELKQNGIAEIIQGNATQLYIRKEAFEENGILHDLLLAQSLKNPVKLRIVLVDGPFVSNDYVSSLKYRDVSILVPQRTWNNEDYRKYQINDLQSSINKELVNLRKNYNPKKDFSSQSNQYFDAYYSIMIFRSSIDDYKNATQEQLTQKINSLANEPAGIYVSPSEKTEDNIATIFIAAGETEWPQEQIKLFAHPDGTITSITSAGITTRNIDYRADPKYGFPNIGDFQWNPNATQQNNDYPVGAQNHQAGENLNHEIMHLNKITLWPLLKGTKPDYSEYNTDLAAIQHMGDTAIEWNSKGDDLAKNPYPFVFKSGNFIQITKDIPSKRESTNS